MSQGGSKQVIFTSLKTQHQFRKGRASPMVGQVHLRRWLQTVVAILTCFGLVILFNEKPDYFLLATMFQICETRCFVVILDRLLIRQVFPRQTFKSGEYSAAGVRPTVKSTRSSVCPYLDCKAYDKLLLSAISYSQSEPLMNRVTCFRFEIVLDVSRARGSDSKALK